MAATITSCKRQLGDTGTLDNSGKDGTAAVKETVLFLVDVAEPTATPLEVTTATFAGMPAYFDTHPIYAVARVTSKVATRARASSGPQPLQAWVVTVTYSIVVPQTNTANSSNVKVSVSGRATTAYTQLSQDSGKTPITNSAGDLYPDPCEITLYDEEITVSYETPNINGGLVAGLRGKINSDPVTMTIPQAGLTYSRSFDKHTLLLESCDYSVTLTAGTGNGGGPTVLTNSTAVWTVTLVLVCRPDGWDPSLPEKGYRWVDDNGDLTEWKDHPQYLTNDGHKLDGGGELVTVDPKPQLYRDGDLASLINSI